MQVPPLRNRSVALTDEVENSSGGLKDVVPVSSTRSGFFRPSRLGLRPHRFVAIGCIGGFVFCSIFSLQVCKSRETLSSIYSNEVIKEFKNGSSVNIVEKDNLKLFIRAIPNTDTPPAFTSSPTQLRKDDKTLERERIKELERLGSIRFHDVKPLERPRGSAPMTTAYLEASVVHRAPWFQPRVKTRTCTESCCAEAVAISLDQDDTRLKNTIDGLDLADVLERGHSLPDHLHFHASVLAPEIIPCLQPGTIIHLDNYGGVIRRFFDVHRPKIKVPFVLITGETDAFSPLAFVVDKLSKRQGDMQIIHWYGHNPDTTKIQQKKRFTPMMLGLSKYHEQMPHLTHFLKATNFTNPFTRENKKRWTESVELAEATDTTPIMFVKFGINPHSQHRKIPWAMACDGRTTQPKDQLTCSHDSFSMVETYSTASKYLFGLSPPGAGKDCYRTYEFLALGVIPIIQWQPDYDVMFKDLPVIQLETWDHSQEELVEIMQNYIASDEFQMNEFPGWERLFLRYWRRKVLDHAEREIFTDYQGKEYYLAWHYSHYKKPLVGN